MPGRNPRLLRNLSWLAAARRVAATTERSCGYLRQEVREAEFRAAKLVEEGGTTAADH